MMMRVRVRPSSSRLVNTVWPRASTTDALFLRRGIGRRGQQGHGCGNGKRGGNDFQTHGFLAGGSCCNAV